MKYIKKAASLLLLVLLLINMLPLASLAEDELPDIPINTSPVVSIKLTSLPKKTNYFVGEDIDVTGAVIRLEHEDGFLESYKVARSWCGDVDNYSAGSVKVFVDYPNRQGYTGANPYFTVTFSTPEVSKIRLEKLPDKTEYFTGEKFISAGLQVFADYTNGDRWDVTNEAVLSGFDPEKAGMQTITVTYSDGKKSVNATFNVLVTQLGIISLEVRQMPTRTTYYEGEELQLDGIRVALIYNDGKEVEVSDLNQISFDGYDPRHLGDQNVSVICQGASSTIKIKTLISPVHQHVAGELQPFSEPTCTEPGYSRAYCTVCGEIANSVKYEPLGHSFSEWETVAETTVEHDGELKRTCSVCNTVETKIIPKLETVLSDAIFTVTPIDSGAAFPSGFSFRTEMISPASVTYPAYANAAADLFPEKRVDVSAMYNFRFYENGSAADLPSGAVISVPADTGDDVINCYAVLLHIGQNNQFEIRCVAEDGVLNFAVPEPVTSSGCLFIRVKELAPEETTAEETTAEETGAEEDIDTTGEEITSAEPEITEPAGPDVGAAGKVVLIAAAVIVGVAGVAFALMLILKKRSYKV